MKKFILIFVLCIFFCFYFGCRSQNERAASDVEDTLELNVEPGEEWFSYMKVAFFSVKKTPQMAAWIEDEDGQYITTITVTKSSAKKMIIVIAIYFNFLLISYIHEIFTLIQNFICFVNQNY